MLKKIIAATLIAGACASAQAGKIVGATGAFINLGAPGYGALEDTHNQAGLSHAYVSGFTDFDDYLAQGPTHIPYFFGFEWYSEDGRSTASVTYDLGMVRRIGAMALWNEEQAGIGTLDLYYSRDGADFVKMTTTLHPSDHPLEAWYPADVFRFLPVDARFIRFDMADCPQGGSFQGCAIGEVAFDEVPEPGPLGLLAIGLAGLLATRRRQARQARQA